MADEEYIIDLLNNSAGKLKLFVDAMKENEVGSAEYHYFSMKIDDMVTHIKKVIERSKIKTIPINNFFNELYLIKDCNIPSVNKLLSFYSYEKLINGIVKKAKKNMKKGIIPENDEKEVMEFLIDNHLLKDGQKDIMEFYINYTLLGEKPVSFETFRTIIIDYAKLLMKEYVPNPEVHLRKTEDLNGENGYTYQNKMFLCYEDIKKMYKHGFFRTLDTIFHELTHISQYADIELKHTKDQRTMTIIKDKILSNLINGYAKANYIVLLSEVEAKINAAKMLNDFFERMNSPLKDKEHYDWVINNYSKILKYRNRIISEEPEDIDELFDAKIINHPEYLAIYPQLDEEYRIEFGDMVVKKDDFAGGKNDRSK